MALFMELFLRIEDVTLKILSGAIGPHYWLSTAQMGHQYMLEGKIASLHVRL